jgi:hypothetical protein
MRTLVFLLATILLGGCAQHAGLGEPSLDTRLGSDFTFLVQNNAFREYIVYYSTRSGSVARLGRVGAANTQEFTAPSYLRNNFVNIRLCEMNRSNCYNVPGEYVGSKTKTFDIRIHERVQLSTIAVWNW